MSVVLSGGAPAEELVATLAALAEQTYPRALTQLIVVGESSAAGEDARALAAELDATWVTAPEAARERTVAAEAAEGEIVLFLDHGLLLPSGGVEAHARWHHTVSDAAVLGIRRGLSARPGGP